MFVNKYIKMELVNFRVDIDLIKNNLEELSDLNRHLILSTNEKLFNLLDFTSDDIFLEPSLFFYPLQGKWRGTTELEQLLYGYVGEKEKMGTFTVISDSNGFINLPGYGYLHTTPDSKFYFEHNDGTIVLKDKMLNVIPYKKIDFKYIAGTRMKLCLHNPELIENYIYTDLYEHVNQTALHFEDKLASGYRLIKGNAPGLADLVELTNREICIFNSKMPPYSMAALFYFGTGLLNVGNVEHNEAFFVDDMAHQCGHTIFYALTLDQAKFIIPPPSAPLKDFTANPNESRDVYGSFHGLFTYTTIIHAITSVIESGAIIDTDVKNELIARLGFYLNKFKDDLIYLNNKDILTNDGFEYWEMFKATYDTTIASYGARIKSLDYSTQTYIFDYSIFCKSNLQTEY